MARTLSRRTVLRGCCAPVAVTVLQTMPVAAQEATPAPDPTVVALERDKLAWEVAKLQEEAIGLRSQNEQPLLDWLRNNAVVVAGLVGGGVTVYRWWVDRDEERAKRDEDRLTAVIDGLGSSDQLARIHAAHNLLTFLEPGYDRFYTRILYLVVAHLHRQSQLDDNQRPPVTPRLIISSRRPPAAKGAELPLFTQALVSVFKDVYPKVRATARPGPVWEESLMMLSGARSADTKLSEEFPVLRKFPLLRKFLLHLLAASREPRKSSRSIRPTWAELQKTRTARYLRGQRRLLVVRPGSPLDMSRIQLPGAFLLQTDLSGVWMPNANLRGANLIAADLAGANLQGADLRGANLRVADLGAKLAEADLTGADFAGAIFDWADLSGVKGLTPEQLHLIRGSMMP